MRDFGYSTLCEVKFDRFQLSFREVGSRSVARRTLQRPVDSADQ